ncbi:MAG: Bax inhibitor-1/YccA family protein [Clostridiales bacterium]|jgi:FtsH-binding integral membrane protein|nr:Bax inhibitor-1/YccA family protein [Clostridiales bacterium]
MQGNYYDNNVVYTQGADESAVNGFMAKVFGWMFVGLLVTCLTTFFIVVGIQSSPAFARMIAGLYNAVFIVFIAEFAIVMFISARIAKMRPATAILLYLLYSMINGLTVGLVALFYAGNGETLGLAFGITALSFGIMAVYGLVTKSDISRIGSLLMMGLFGVIIVSVVNIFLGNSMLDFIICVVGLFIFLGLTAYDTNKIKNFYAHAALGGGNADGGYAVEEAQIGLESNLAIYGALILYLDFINIFLRILRLLGRGRN